MGTVARDVMFVRQHMTTRPTRLLSFLPPRRADCMRRQFCHLLSRNIDAPLFTPQSRRIYTPKHHLAMPLSRHLSLCETSLVGDSEPERIVIRDKMAPTPRRAPADLGVIEIEDSDSESASPAGEYCHGMLF